MGTQSFEAMWNSRNIDNIRAPDSPVQALEDDVMDVFDPVDIINDNDDINKDENDDREAEGYPNLGRFHVRSVGSHNMDTNFPSLSMPPTNSSTPTTNLTSPPRGCQGMTSQIWPKSVNIYPFK